VRQSGPALLIGDLNTGLRAKRLMPQFLSLCASWERLQPTGLGSFFGKSGLVSEIDHALLAGPVDATAWYLRRVGHHELAGAPAALSDHSALYVQLDLRHCA
jgi:endonuclease/exonuclease/phosphatase (EEP) superfamily protein YafD